MEPAQSIEECQNRKTRKGRSTKKCEMERENIKQLSASSSGRRTRSQVAPEWTTNEALILVNEIAAIEGDNLKVLGSYQKWNMVVQNCNALDVARTLNQCRSKWNSLLAEYNQIKQWNNSMSINNSYWSFESEVRKQVGLPENFDSELFKAIDDYVLTKKDQSDEDRDSDEEADDEFLDVIAKLGSKRRKRRLTSLKTCMEEKPKRCYTEEMPRIIIDLQEEPLKINMEDELQTRSEKDESQNAIHVEEAPQKSMAEDKPQICYEPQTCCEKDESQNAIHVEEAPQKSIAEDKTQICCENEKPLNAIPAEEEPKESLAEEEPEKIHAEEEYQGNPREDISKNSSVQNMTISEEEEEDEEMVVEKLLENTELIHAIVAGNIPGMEHLRAAGLKDEENQRKFIRYQGDKLIECFGEIVNILKKYPHLVQASD